MIKLQALSSPTRARLSGRTWAGAWERVDPSLFGTSERETLVDLLQSDRPGSIPAIILFCFVLFCYLSSFLSQNFAQSHTLNEDCALKQRVSTLNHCARVEQIQRQPLRSLVSASTLISVMLQRLTHITTDDEPAKESFIDELEYLGYSSQNQSSKTI